MSMVSEKSDITEQDLASILDSYNEATERLKESHDILQREVRRLRNELEQKNRQLERRKRLAALGEMAAGLAHEIRNPLGGIQLYANLLSRDLTENPELKNVADKIVMGVKTLDGLVTDVLSLTHTIEPKFKSSDLIEILNFAIELIQNDIQEKQVQVSLHTPVTHPLVCDPNMLQRALLNLLRNAIEASGVDGQVFVDVENSKEDVIIRISDTGPGIDESLFDRVFNPFFTTKDNGTGLGLSIVHRIVESHSGSISVTNSDSGGALFTITLPGHLERSISNGYDRSC